ncbi:oligosaccharide flippase family protein [Azohydromonas sp. G-1-1-14]|uniref:Oligosaccharide flippase family protein n=1 Tax=Azohydromonas caseinilytica TaxID=2728836 RepID=A0A848F9F1_9BURK|nr:oligosaccharide flippase family protein [Azohydromonas caseinilytica]
MLTRLRSSALFSGAATYLVSNILNAAIPFLLLPLLTRYLGPAGYGEVAMFMVLLGALESWVGLSVAGAAGRKYYDGAPDARALRDFIAAGLQLLLATALLAAGVLWLLRAPLAQALELPPRWLPWAVFVSACGVVVNIRLGQWQVRHEARRFGTLQISQGLLGMALSLLLVVGLGQGADGRITAQIVTAGLFALLALALLRRDALLAFLVWRPAYLKEALAFGLPLVPHFAGLFLLNALDRVLVNAKLGLAEAGVYMVAVQLANAMGLVFDALNKAYGPWLYERLQRDRPEEKRRIVRWTYAWFVVVLLGAALAFQVGPRLVGLIAGERFAHAGEVIGWLALGQAFNGMYFMVTNYIFYSRRTGALALATVGSGLVHVGLVLGLVPVWGIEGAGMAFSISMGLRFGLTWWVAQRRHPMPWLRAVVAGSS